MPWAPGCRSAGVVLPIQELQAVCAEWPRSAHRHRARPWTGAYEDSPSLTTIPHSAPPLGDYRVVAGRQPAGASLASGIHDLVRSLVGTSAPGCAVPASPRGDAQPPGARG